MATTLASISIKDSSSWHTYLDLIYPIGSYYLSNSSTSPGSRFGGTWTQIKDQRFLCGYTYITTGGANSVTLDTDQIPAHDHSMYNTYDGRVGENWSSGGSDGVVWGVHISNTWDLYTGLRGGGQESRKPTLVPHLFYVVQDCVTTLPLLEVI